MTRQQTMLDNFWPLEPRLFFFRLAYSIKYFVRSFISSIELDFRDYHYSDSEVFSILQIFYREYWVYLAFLHIRQPVNRVFFVLYSIVKIALQRVQVWNSTLFLSHK